MLRILLLGKYGQLGWELNRTLAPLGQIVSLDYPDIDLTQTDKVRKIVRNFQPELIVNATAYTAVDRAESEIEIARAINGLAPGLLAEEALLSGAGLIHYSTDYVFDGKKGIDYLETDQPNPLGVYGQSKLEGEEAIITIGGAYLILRTSWVYSLRRDSFVTKVLKWSRQQSTMRIVSDQIGNPTWSRMLAEVTAQLVARATHDVSGWLREHKGLYHLAGSGRASRYEWALAILQSDPLKEEQVVQEVLPGYTAEFPTPAERPLHSALDCEHFTNTFGLRLPDWEDALKLALDMGV